MIFQLFHFFYRLQLILREQVRDGSRLFLAQIHHFADGLAVFQHIYPHLNPFSQFLTLVSPFPVSKEYIPACLTFRIQILYAVHRRFQDVETSELCQSL